MEALGSVLLVPAVRMFRMGVMVMLLTGGEARLGSGVKSVTAAAPVSLAGRRMHPSLLLLVPLLTSPSSRLLSSWGSRMGAFARGPVHMRARV